ncbi:MAG: CRISPR-associated protein Cas7 [Longimicrobiales bacterium]
MPSPYLYLRGLRQADHAVFCVADGQKTYWDPRFEVSVAYSSGQQVKRSILDAVTEALGEMRAPITFNYEINKDKAIENKEPWSPCDPHYVDQLLGGWMKAQPKQPTLKRRSPLSISAMRPLHPLLASLAKENLTFDRSEQPERHPVRVLNSAGDELSAVEIDEFLESNARTLPRRHWIPENRRTTGLFVHDVAVDLRRLFKVSTNRHDPEMSSDMVERLRNEGWAETDGGEYLLAPDERREDIIPALARGLVEWRITSNQSRTYSPQTVLALAIGDNAHRVSAAIRADLEEDGESAEPVIDHLDGVDLFIALPAKGYVQGVSADADALEKADAQLVRRLRSFDYTAPMRQPA